MRDENVNDAATNEKTKDKNRPILLPVVIFILAAIFLYKSVTESVFMEKTIPGDGFFPTIMSVCVMAVSLLAVVNGFRDKREKDFCLVDLLPVAAIVGICFAGKLIGTFPAVLLMLVLWYRKFEKMSWKKTLAISIIYTVVMYLVFEVWIQVRLDTGLVGKLLGI